MVVRDVMEEMLVVRGGFLWAQAAIPINRAIERGRMDSINTMFPFL
jgi:hypothetical protein